MKAAGLILTALLTLVGSSPSMASDALSDASRDIVDFHWLQDGSVFRGGRPNSDGIQDLKNLNVATVVDLQGGDIHGKNFLINLYNSIAEAGEHRKAILKEKLEVLASGMEFISRPLNANDRVTDIEAQTINEILEILHERQDQPVFVHCQHGRDRTGLIMALYEVKYLGVSPEAAHDEMVRYGHKGFLDHLFTGALDRFFWSVAPQMASGAQANDQLK